VSLMEPGRDTVPQQQDWREQDTVKTFRRIPKKRNVRGADLVGRKEKGKVTCRFRAPSAEKDVWEGVNGAASLEGVNKGAPGWGRRWVCWGERERLEGEEIAQLFDEDKKVMRKRPSEPNNPTPLKQDAQRLEGLGQKKDGSRSR